MAKGIILNERGGMTLRTSGNARKGYGYTLFAETPTHAIALGTFQSYRKALDEMDRRHAIQACKELLGKTIVIN